MSKNPARVKKNSHYKQGNYKCKNPEKYIGDSSYIPYRSGLEFRVCSKLDRADYIVGWAIEPLWIKYISPKDNLPHKYFIDFLTVTLNKDDSKNVTLVEVKSYSQTLPPKSKGKKKSRFLKEALDYEINQAKWKYAKDYCNKKGWKFVIMTEQEILGKKKTN